MQRLNASLTEIECNLLHLRSKRLGFISFSAWLRKMAHDEQRFLESIAVLPSPQRMTGVHGAPPVGHHIAV